MDRLTSLAVFGRVVETGGFSAAARKLNMSTTMVANHIQSLEERLGVRLLNRTTRRVSLTETGRYYYDHSSRILAELEDIDRAAGALNSTPRGKLKIYATTAIARFLAPVMDEYLKLYPTVAIDFDIGERMIDMIEEGYDLAIRATLLPDSTLISRKLTSWRHFLVCSPEYLDRHPAPEEPSDLKDHNCLQYAYYANGVQWRFNDQSGSAHEVKVAGTVVSNSAETLRHLAIGGQGLFLAPSFVVAEDIDAGRLIKLMPRFQAPESLIAAVFPDRSHMPSKARLFIDLLVERFTEHRKWMT